jgi:hypothetical protein
MTKQTAITVYNFRTLDGGFESSPVSSFKATRQAILEHFSGDPIEATAESVAVSELDRHGCFRRLTAEWGDLGA